MSLPIKPGVTSPSVKWINWITNRTFSTDPRGRFPNPLLNQNRLRFFHWWVMLSQSLSGSVFTTGIVLETRKLLEGKGRVPSWSELVRMSHAGNRHQ